MAQPVAIEEYEAARRDAHRSGHRRPARLAGMQLVIETAAGVVEYSEQHRVAAAPIVGRVVVPANVIAGSRVEIQGIGVRIIRWRLLQRFPGKLLQPADEHRRTVQRRDERGPIVDRVAAHAAALLVPGQVVAVDQRLDRTHGRHQAFSDRCAEKLGQVQEGSLLHERAPRCGIRGGESCEQFPVRLRRARLGWTPGGPRRLRSVRMRRGYGGQATSEDGCAGSGWERITRR